MFEQEILKRMRITHTIDKEKLAVELRKSVGASFETTFRILRHLAKQGKITALGNGIYRYQLKDDKSGDLTTWIK